MAREKPWKFKTFPGSFDNLNLVLTDESKQVFEQAKSHQGFIGLVDLRTGNMHLVPCFNYPQEIRDMHKTPDNQDDAEYFSQWNRDLHNVGNKNGEYFSVTSPTGVVRGNYYVSTIEDLGTNTGVAHGRALALCGLSGFGGEKGGVLGFGIWKGTQEVIMEFRDRSASQNRHAIQFSAEFLDDYLTEKYKTEDPEGHAIIKHSRERSLPQEIGDKILANLLAQLPTDKFASRKALEDDRVFDFPNPFISAAEQGDRLLMNAYINAGMNINEIATPYQWTALHACSNLEVSDPEKIKMLVDLLKNDAIKYDIKDSDGSYFYDYLESNEIIAVLNALYESKQIVAAANLIVFLVTQNHSVVNDISSLDLFSDVLLKVKVVAPDFDILPLIKLIDEKIDDNLLEVEPAHPLFQTIEFLKTSKGSQSYRKLDLSLLDPTVIEYGLKLAIEYGNVDMIKHIFKSADPRFMQEVYRDEKFWVSFSSARYSLDRIKKAKVTDVLMVGLRHFNFETHEQMRLLRSELATLEMLIKNLDFPKDDILKLPNYYQELKQIESQFSELQGKLRDLEKPLQFFSHKSAKAMMHSRKGFHQLLDFDKKYQQLSKMENNVMGLIQERKKASATWDASLIRNKPSLK